MKSFKDGRPSSLIFASEDDVPLRGRRKKLQIEKVRQLSVTIRPEQFDWIEKERKMNKRSTFISYLLGLGIEAYKRKKENEKL